MRHVTLAIALLLAALGPAAAQEVRVPPGFRIELWARVPGARSLAVGAGGTVFVGTRGSAVYAVPRAGEVHRFAAGLAMHDPNGVCLDGSGTLFVAERNRVLAFPDAERHADGGEAPAQTVVPQGGLIPAAEESATHGARVCRVGPDGLLYVALGQPYNVPPKRKRELYAQWGIGGIVRMARDGSGREVFARGIRNSVGLDVDAAGRLWFTDNQVDLMGDDIPPGEINRADRPGLDFGFPWYGGGHVRTREYADETPPPGLVFPVVEEVAHAADLGLHIYRGAMFPATYRGAIFSAQHGSWNRTVPVGARVMLTPVAADGSAGPSRPFAEGWLDPASGRYSGRPVDVAELPDGSLLVSDDAGGALWRISYGG